MLTSASIQIAQSLQKALNGLLGFIPNLLGFLLILLVGFFIARLVKGIVTTLLEARRAGGHPEQTTNIINKGDPANA